MPQTLATENIVRIQQSITKAACTGDVRHLDPCFGTPHLAPGKTTLLGKPPSPFVRNFNFWASYAAKLGAREVIAQLLTHYGVDPNSPPAQAFKLHAAVNAAHGGIYRGPDIEGRKQTSLLDIPGLVAGTTQTRPADWRHLPEILTAYAAERPDIAHHFRQRFLSTLFPLVLPPAADSSGALVVNPYSCSADDWGSWLGAQLGVIHALGDPRRAPVVVEALGAVTSPHNAMACQNNPAAEHSFVALNLASFAASLETADSALVGLRQLVAAGLLDACARTQSLGRSVEDINASFSSMAYNMHADKSRTPRLAGVFHPDHIPFTAPDAVDIAKLKKHLSVRLKTIEALLKGKHDDQLIPLLYPSSEQTAHAGEGQLTLNPELTLALGHVLKNPMDSLWPAWNDAVTRAVCEPMPPVWIGRQEISAPTLAGVGGMLPDLPSARSAAAEARQAAMDEAMASIHRRAAPLRDDMSRQFQVAFLRWLTGQARVPGEPIVPLASRSARQLPPPPVPLPAMQIDIPMVSLQHRPAGPPSVGPRFVTAIP